MDFTILRTVTLSLTVCMASSQANVRVNSTILHLTPYIDNSQFELGRQLSLITHDVIPRSHAGFITVDKQLGNHLFFWFFPAISLDPQSPLLVWLNGGPGISSMVGLFYENGPLRIQAFDLSIGFTRWNKSWAENVSMLYIDQPVGTGYSYTESDDDLSSGYRVNQDGCSGDLYEFIKQFYLLFPEYKSRDLYLGGQSYAGKYIPALASRIHTEKLANRSNIRLTGIYIGGALFDPKRQLIEDARFYETFGAISKKQVDRYYNNFRMFQDTDFSDYSFGDVSGILFLNLQMHDLENYVTLASAPYVELHAIMNSPEMRRIIKVGNLIFSSIKYRIADYLMQDFMGSEASSLAQLMDNYKVLLYNGDMDGVIGSEVLDGGIMALTWSGQAQYNNSERQVWRRDDNILGFYTQTGRFCRVVIRGAGHRVPHDQPDVSRDMILQFIQSGCIQQ